MKTIDELIKKYTKEAEECEANSKMFRATRTFQETNKVIARQRRLTIMDLLEIKQTI